MVFPLVFLLLSVFLLDYTKLQTKRVKNLESFTGQSTLIQSQFLLFLFHQLNKQKE